MNTYIWGPSLWRILHTVAFVPDSEVAERLVRVLKKTLPCSFCRESFGGFVRQLDEKYQLDVRDVVSQGKLYQWMYDIHELVNDKLDRQRAHDAVKPMAVAAMAASRGASSLSIGDMTSVLEKAMETGGAFRSRRPTLECVEKRFAIQPVAFSAADVFSFMFIVALNYPSEAEMRTDATAPERAASYPELWSVLGEVVRKCGGAPALAMAIGDAPNDSIPNHPSDSWWFQQVYLARCAFRRDKPSTKKEMDLKKRYALAKAGSCIHGSCI